MAELVAACKGNGVWPFVHMNRLHLVPPLVISEDELSLGLKAIDDALVVLRRYAG
jgi:taurine--2-oxoglutarate transaminase